jgi:outer membrane protein/adhesin transport system outer membrane protein
VLVVSGLLAATCLMVSGLAPARAQTLEEALVQAYSSNPTLGAARATLRSVDEDVPAALAGQRPSPAVVASAGPAWTQSNLFVPTVSPNQTTRTTPRSVGLSVTQPIYQGGQIEARISQAENTVLAQQAALLDAEQTVLLQAAAAYLDVVQDQALLDLQVNYETFQKRDLEAIRDRFRVGEVTQTDVSLQEAQVASATAARVAAQGVLSAVRATYTKLIGSPPGTLVQPKLKYPLPANLDETVTQARARNPSVVTAVHTETAARDAVDVADGALLPTVSVTASISRDLDREIPNDFTNGGSIVANVTIPFDNGGAAAKARAARQSASSARITIDQALRAAEEAAVTDWENLVTARASITSFEAAVKANELAAEGMRQQVSVGASTVIDLLNTEQTLLNARVNLVKAHHDESVAVFGVLSAVGQLTAQALQLPTPYYDYKAHYEAVRDKWFGTGIDQP